MSQEDSIISSFGQLPSSSDRRDTSSIIERIDPSITSEKILRELAGQVWDARTGKFVTDPTLLPLINQEGLGRIRVMFDTLINQNTSLSNLDEKEVYGIIRAFGEEVINVLAINYKNYNIKNPSDAMTIAMAVSDNALFCLKRGFKAGEKKFLNTSLRSHETITHVDRSGEKKKFGLGGFKF